MTSLPSRHHQDAFTTLEMMTVIVIIAVLLTMLFVVFQNVTEQGMDARCIGNLRQIGVALLTHASEHGGKIPARIERDPKDPGKNDAKTYWHRILRDKGYLPPDTTSKNSIFMCPSVPLVKGVATGYQTYGYRVWCAPGTSIYVPQSLLVLEKPSDFFLAVDSYASVYKSQGYYVAPGSEWQVHLRHSGEANTLFADGHVAPKGAEYFDRISEEQKEYADTPATSFRYRDMQAP